MNYLYFNDCLGLDKVDRNYHVSAGEINPATGKAYAIRPDGVWDDNYFSQNFANKASNNYGNPGATASLEQLTQRQLQLQREAAQPAISSLEQSIPEVQQKYQTARTGLEAQREPLKQRYNNLLDELKRKEGVQVQQTQTATAREYGKRGIPLSSGVYDQALIENTRPINEFYTGQYKDVSLSQEQSLGDLQNQITNLTGDEVESTRVIKNAIASLQMGASQQAISGAFQQLGMEMQQAQFAASQLAQQSQFDKSYSLDEQRINQSASEFERSLAEQQRQFNVSQANKGTEPNKSEGYRIQALQDIFGGYRYGSLINKYGAYLDESWLRASYNAGPTARKYGAATEGKDTSQDLY
jgi:hypothetical protein